jgi:hypothetical protein
MSRLFFNVAAAAEPPSDALRHGSTLKSEEQRDGGIPLAPEERSGAKGTPDSAFGMTVRGTGTAMHTEWPCYTGPKRGCRAEVPGATFKAKTHPKRQKQIPRLHPNGR